MKKAETPSLTYSPRNAWDVYTTATQKRQMDALVKRYMDFLSNCKTERETVAYVQKRLQEAGFSEDFKKNAVFRNLRGKAIFAARKGKIPLQKGVHLIAAHADSPRLDFKQRPLIEQPGVAQAKTHYYGGWPAPWPCTAWWCWRTAKASACPSVKRPASPSSPSPTCCPTWPASKAARPWPKSLTAKS